MSFLPPARVWTKSLQQSSLIRYKMSSNYPTPLKERAAEIAASLQEVRNGIKEAAQNSLQNDPSYKEPRLVAVSKYKPAEDIMACYNEGHRDFGENYASELVEKASILPSDIRWHFIGALQSNKCKVLAAIPNIYAVQTLDGEKKAAALNRLLLPDRSEPLNVYIQINTSGEDVKAGIPPLVSSSIPPAGEAIDLARFIMKECPRLKLAGLMTIGSLEASIAEAGENQDFRRLVETRNVLEPILKSEESIQGFGVDGRLELSMGMSADYVAAIKAGSGSVRVGTSIFGTRLAKN